MRYRHTSEADLQTIATHWRKQLLLSNQEYSDLQEILTLHTSLGAWETLGVAKKKRLASAKRFPSALAILQSEDRPMFVFVKQAIAQLVKTGLAPDPLLRGDDLVDLGIPPSEAIGTILEAIYDAQLEGGIRNREEAISFAKALILDIFNDN